ncbi:MAG: hypothetical protein H0W58_00195 [Acidobacteria bacterium]|jgi:hypothetical protein|nr:hypothetical protein [Acidobacteriota bacterium]
MLQETQTSNNIPIIAIIVSICSLLISIGSLLISYFNFHRDKYKVVVDLDWDNGKHHVGMRSNVVETWGAIFVRNEGRRPVFIRLIGIKYPDDERVFNLLENDKAEGVKLSEGDPPIVVKVPHDALLKRHVKHWEKLYAVAYDVSGREYKSGKPWNKPSWAE